MRHTSTYIHTQSYNHRKDTHARAPNGWCVANLPCLPYALLHMFADLLLIEEATDQGPQVMPRGYIPLHPKGEGMLPMEQRPVFGISQHSRVVAQIRLEG